MQNNMTPKEQRMREEWEKLIKEYYEGDVGMASLTDFWFSILSKEREEWVKRVEGMKKKVCGCDEDDDPQAPGYHTKDCDMRPYGYNQALDDLKAYINFDRDFEIIPEKRQVLIAFISLLRKNDIESVREWVEGIVKDKEYKAMVENGDLSFLNYMPTEIYNLALKKVSSHLSEELKKI